MKACKPVQVLVHVPLKIGILKKLELRMSDWKIRLDGKSSSVCIVAYQNHFCNINTYFQVYNKLVYLNKNYPGIQIITRFYKR